MGRKGGKAGCVSALCFYEILSFDDGVAGQVEWAIRGERHFWLTSQSGERYLLLESLIVLDSREHCGEITIRGRMNQGNRVS